MSSFSLSDSLSSSNFEFYWLSCYAFSSPVFHYPGNDTKNFTQWLRHWDLIFIMIETLRQTPLKVFIPGLARSLSAVTASALFAFGVFVCTYLLGWDRTKDIDQFDSRWVKIANETGQKCLINSTVDIWLVSMTTFGNVVVLFFCSFWETVPFVRYVWYRYNCSLPKVQKYLEILAFKERT